MHLAIVYSNRTCFIDTAPFKFDVPSPDDLVSNGLHSSEQHSKGIMWLLQWVMLKSFPNCFCTSH